MDRYLNCPNGHNTKQTGKDTACTVCSFNASHTLEESRKADLNWQATQDAKASTAVYGAVMGMFKL